MTYSKDSIKFFPNKILLHNIIKNEPFIKEIDQHILDVMDRLQTMVKDFGAAGLAAPQIGEYEPIIAIEGTKFKGIMVNPVILESSEDIRTKERCLSFPKCREVSVKRKNKITVQYLDNDLEDIVQDLEGTDAIIVQHEIDHLFGKTLYQTTTAVERVQLLRDLNKAKRYINKMFK